MIALARFIQVEELLTALFACAKKYIPRYISLRRGEKLSDLILEDQRRHYFAVGEKTDGSHDSVDDCKINSLLFPLL